LLRKWLSGLEAYRIAFSGQHLLQSNPAHALGSAEYHAIKGKRPQLRLVRQNAKPGAKWGRRASLRALKARVLAGWTNSTPLNRMICVILL
jgi:hypothetical protein